MPALKMSINVSAKFKNTRHPKTIIPSSKLINLISMKRSSIITALKLGQRMSLGHLATFVEN